MNAVTTGQWRCTERPENPFEKLTRAVQEAFGKKVLINAIRQAQPLSLPVLGGCFEIWLMAQPHRLPGTLRHRSSLENGNSRLWLQCPGCRRVVGKLFYFYLSPGSLMLSDLLCRTCHGLVYQSQNCGGNRWYRETARPLKRLLQEKRRLQARHQTRRVATRLAAIEDETRTLRQKVRPRTKLRNQNSRSRLSSPQRRSYRNLALLEQFVKPLENVKIQSAAALKAWNPQRR